jgi:hypothetical protein
LIPVQARQVFPERQEVLSSFSFLVFFIAERKQKWGFFLLRLIRLRYGFNTSSFINSNNLFNSNSLFNEGFFDMRVFNRTLFRRICFYGIVFCRACFCSIVFRRRFFCKRLLSREFFSTP